MGNDISGRIDSSSDLSELLRNIDQEITEGVLVYGDGLKNTSEDKQQEIGRHICFELGGRQLALPLSLVVEVGELESVRPLPFLPEWVQGVTNIRGEIVSVTDVALYLNISKKSNKKRNRAVIIIYNGEVKTAVVVDRITATRMLYRKKEVEEGRQVERIVLDDFLSGLAVYHSGRKEEVVQLFDGEQLLSSIRI
ncbi:Chemotaxis signal transduction protein [Candidatus Electrothrix aarhusensis]|jgi:chemotaxis signal transduction protein|uniref:Chemotaxis signal transduction protein n=1 Tax=Candidatus Electrothrix aarhusensis TaxID=1859131 RepID=A0A444IWG4_9BACT|nr:Chemotaxis signal transduction protein [Candidatus Electrothrix aarhusensis]